MKNSSLDLSRLIFRCAVIFIVCSISGSLVYSFSPIEFVSDDLESTIQKIVFCGVPLAIIALLAGILKRDDDFFNILIKVLIVGFFGVIYFLISITFLFASMCNYTTKQTLLYSKENNDITIVERSFGCGATDSGPPSVNCYKRTPITFLMAWYEQVDTNEINHDEWIRFKKP